MAANNAAVQSLDESAVLATLVNNTYQQTADRFGVSRGSIYRIAHRFNARKNEERIQERAADRKKRQKEMLSEILDVTQTANVLDYLADIPDDCAQLVITSCPYNLGKKYGESASSDSMRHVMYLGWMTMVVSEMSRIVKPGGMIFLQCGSTRDELDGSMMPIDIMLFDVLRKTGMTYQNRVSWIIPHGLTPKQRLSERHESGLIFCKGKAPSVFNAAPARTPQKQPSKRAFKGPNKGALSGHPLGAWPSDVWTIGNVGANHPEKTGHPAQFPEELVSRAIQLYTNPGDLVIDPFCGSGTSHVVARKTGRDFTGCDLFYEDMREKRLADAGLDDLCRLPGVSDESVAVWQAEARSCGVAVSDIKQGPANENQKDLFS